MKLGHTLIFGGTGMLREATAWITEHSCKTVVFGRNIQRLNRIGQQYDNVVTRVLDYQNTSKLKQEIKLTYEENGPIKTVVAWIHGIAPNAIPTIKEKISSLQDNKWTLFLIKGSSSDLNSIITSSDTDLPVNCELKEIQLGFKIIGTSSRWLTHEEISNGVIEGIKKNSKKTVVGTLYPWDKRP